MKKEYLKNKNQSLKKLATTSLLAYCLTFALSIAASKLFACINILTFLLQSVKKISSEDLKSIILSLSFFILVCIISIPFGVNIENSAISTLKLAFYSLFLISAYNTLQNIKVDKVISFLLIGQCLAAIHTITSLLTGINYFKPPGAVTESGQIVLILPLAFALCYKYSNKFYNLAFLLLLSALVINLKRGPWLAVIFQFTLIGILISRKILISTAVLSFSLFFIEPIRDRLLSLIDHFLIAGGRFNMWSLGVEIFSRYPLGLGYDNSEFMRTMDPSLPITHRHMHNNLINIGVETGFIGLAAYSWFLFVLFKVAKKSYFKTKDIVLLCLGMSLAGWQVAGLVEYNFGDSEILFIALLIIACLSFKSTSSKNIVV